MPKVTLKDVATEAGVGTATVERALNGRGGVTDRTVEAVLKAARKLNYRRPLPRAHHSTVRIEVILVRPDTTFFARLNRAFEGIAAALASDIVIHRTFVQDNDPSSVANHILNPAFRRSGLIVVAPEHPSVRTSLEQVHAAGVEVMQIVSRSAGPEIPYVGVDHYAAGRTAAFFMSSLSRSRTGRFVALCHSGVYHAHKERIKGFSDFLEEHPNRDHSFSLVMMGHDKDIRSSEIFDETLARDPGVIGLYTAGGGEHLLASVIERRKKTGDLVWIGHELTDMSKRHLRDGIMTIVLDQAPELQAKRSFDTIMLRLGLIDVDVETDPVRFQVIVNENI